MAYDEAAALLVSLARETEELDLGAHGAVELTYDELRPERSRSCTTPPQSVDAG